MLKPSTGASVRVRTRLKELVAADPRSAQEIGFAAAMSKSQFYGLLAGDRKNPSVETIARILVALGRRWGDLDETR